MPSEISGHHSRGGGSSNHLLCYAESVESTPNPVPLIPADGSVDGPIDVQVGLLHSLTATTARHRDIDPRNTLVIDPNVWLKWIGQMNAREPDLDQWDNTLASDESYTYMGPTSGHALSGALLEFDALKETQRLLDAQLQLASITRGLVVRLYEAELVDMLASRVSDALSLAKWRVVNKRIRLKRRIKALKRDMRTRQHNVFIRLSDSDRIWYLFHGTHPPEAQCVFGTQIASGGVRA